MIMNACDYIDNTRTVQLKRGSLHLSDCHQLAKRRPPLPAAGTWLKFMRAGRQGKGGEVFFLIQRTKGKANCIGTAGEEPV